MKIVVEEGDSLQGLSPGTYEVDVAAMTVSVPDYHTWSPRSWKEIARLSIKATFTVGDRVKEDQKLTATQVAQQDEEFRQSVERWRNAHGMSVHGPRAFVQEAIARAVTAQPVTSVGTFEVETTVGVDGVEHRHVVPPRFVGRPNRSSAPDPTHWDRMEVNDPKSEEKWAKEQRDIYYSLPPAEQLAKKWFLDVLPPPFNSRNEAHVPLAKKAPCRECSGTGFYESPVSGKRSPCSAGCKASC